MPPDQIAFILTAIRGWGISKEEVASWYGCSVLSLEKMEEHVFTFRNPNDRINNRILVKKSKINKE